MVFFIYIYVYILVCINLVDMAIHIKNLGRRHFTCEQCGKSKTTEQYEYKNATYVADYEPYFWRALCKNCLKREMGTKVYERFLLGERT